MIHHPFIVVTYYSKERFFQSFVLIEFDEIERKISSQSFVLIEFDPIKINFTSFIRDCKLLQLHFSRLSFGFSISYFLYCLRFNFTLKKSILRNIHKRTYIEEESIANLSPHGPVS